MFIDFLTLMLINMVAGLVIFALYLLRWGRTVFPQKAIPGFLLTGAIALITGFHMIFQWPLPALQHPVRRTDRPAGGFLFTAG